MVKSGGKSTKLLLIGGDGFENAGTVIKRQLSTMHLGQKTSKKFAEDCTQIPHI
jgi:hypothetical protein